MGTTQLGSVSIPIAVQIQGYEEQIAKMKAMLKNINIDSPFGRNFKNDLKSLESIVARIKNSADVRAGSFSGINKIQDRLDGVAIRMQHLGEMLQNFGATEIDYSSIEGYAEATKKIEDAMAAYEASMNTGMRDAIKHNSDLRAAFQALGVDIEKIGAADGIDILAKASEDASFKVAKAEERVEALGQAIDNLTSKKNKLEALQTSMNSLNGEREVKNLTSTTRTLRNFNTNGGRIDPNALLTNYLTAINSSISDTSARITGRTAGFAKGTISGGQIHAQINDVETLIKLYEKLRAAARAAGLSEDRIAGATARAFGGQRSDKNARQYMLERFGATVNTSASKNYETQLTDILSRYGDNITTSEMQGVISFVRNGDIQSAEQEAIRLIREAGARVQAQVIETKNAIAATQGERSEAVNALTNTKADDAAADAAYAHIQAEFEAQERLNAAKAEAVALAEKERDALIERQVSTVKDLGSQISDQGAKHLQENAKMAKQYSLELENAQKKEKLLGNITSFVQRWFSVYAVVRMVSKAFNTMKSTLKELDDIMTNIAIVTDMSQSDLWAQMPTYADMATKYGASIKGVYEVSQLYYQQGLETADVMTLTEETLKMAKISGLDYAEATNYRLKSYVA